jgi:type I restriction enzyme, S subunit
MNSDGKFAVYGGNGINGRHDEYMFEHPQVTIGRVGVYCGAVHITEPKSWVTDNALYVSDNKFNLDPIYLAWAIRFANLNQYAGKAAQPLISGGRIYPIEILVPSKEEQTRFSALCTSVEAAAKRNSIIFEADNSLFASLQYRAFSGQI